MTNHIALSHTPFHLLQLGIIADQLRLSGDMLTIWHEGPRTDVPGLDSARLFVLPGFGDYGAGRRQSAANARQILEHLQPGAMLYVSDLRWLTNNVVYFARDKQHRSAQTVLFADGLGSYLDRRECGRTSATAAVKALLGAAGHGPKHVPLLGNHFGLDARYASSALAFRPELLAGNLPAKALRPINMKTPDPQDTRDTLIIGVPLRPRQFSKPQAEQILMRTFAAATDITPSHEKIYYKPHHFEEAWIVEWYAKRAVQIVQDPRPAELVLHEARFSRVIGAHSSVLAFGPEYTSKQCKAYSVSFNAVTSPYLGYRDSRELRRVMEVFGVDFLD